MTSLRNILNFPLYYAQVLVHRLSGKANMNMRSNGEFKTLRRLLTGGEKYVLDVGGNIGDWTYEATKVSTNAGSRFHIVDANPRLFDRLKAKYDSDPRVSFSQNAVSDFDGSADFWIDDKVDAYSGSNSLIKHYYLEGAALKVSVVTLDTLVSRLGWPTVDLLKLDIEGSEVKALRGARTAMGRGLIKCIQVEYDKTWISAGASLQDVFAICRDAGYKVFRIGSKGLIPLTSYHYVLDDFVYSNLLLVAPNVSLDIPIQRKPVPFLTD